MKILMVTMQYGGPYTQGTERYVTTLGEELRKRGHEVIVLAGDPLGVRPAMRLGEAIPGEPGLFSYPTRGWMSVLGLPPREVAEVVSRFRPDVVHLNTPAHIGVGMIGACRKLGIPCVVTVHDHWWVCPKGTLLRPDGVICDGTPGWSTCIRCVAGEHSRRWVRRAASIGNLASPLLMKLYGLRAMPRGMSIPDLWRWMYRRRYLCGQLDRTDFIVFPSKSIAEIVALRLSHRRWQIIPNGLTSAWFENPRATPTAPQPPESLTLGFSGALAEHKAPHLLLEAVRALGWTQTRVRIAGGAADPAYEARLRHAARGLNVEFAGRLSAKNMPAFLRSLDILAMTSVWPENCPYAVLEAQAAGVAVAGSRAGGVAEMIPDERLLFDPGSVQGLAAAMEFARCNPGVGRSARVATAREMADAVEGVYRQSIRGGMT